MKQFWRGWRRKTAPEKIEKDLENLFPKSHWRIINYIVVRFGQTYKSRKEKNRILDDVRRMR